MKEEGIVGMESLQPGLLLDRAGQAGTIEDLSAVRREMIGLAEALLDERRSPCEAAETLSRIHHRIQRRCFEIVLEEREGEAGQRPPDIRFCLFIMGSGGRREMLLAPDQDNGLLYEDFPDARIEEVDAFFAPLARRVVEAFAAIGYPLCNGGVMASNPLWRGRLMDWRRRISNWIEEPAPKRVMYSTIFLDFVPLAGDPALCRDLRGLVHEEIRENPGFLYYLMENDLKNRVPLGLFGRFVTERGREHRGKLSLKQGGSLSIVDCIRMFVLELGIDATTTLERMEVLLRRGVLKEETAGRLRAALETFTLLRLRHEIASIGRGREPSHYIDPRSLAKNEQARLKEAFRAVAKLQDTARMHFGQGIL